MTTQRDRLAAVLHEMSLSDGYLESDTEAADALLARGVRVVDCPRCWHPWDVHAEVTNDGCQFEDCRCDATLDAE